MIESGLKKEEYREIKPYWTKRLFDENGIPKPFETVRFSYGYTNRYMEKKIKSIRIGIGNPQWRAPGNEVYIIELE